LICKKPSIQLIFLFYVKKLRATWVEPSSIKWFNSYLTGRTQKITLMIAFRVWQIFHVGYPRIVFKALYFYHTWAQGEILLWPIVRHPSSVRTSVNNFSSETIGFWLNFTGIIPGWSSIKVVQTVLIGCISRSRGQKIGLQNAILKNLLVWNYKVQSFHIWYIALSRGILPKLFKLCPWGQN